VNGARDAVTYLSLPVRQAVHDRQARHIFTTDSEYCTFLVVCPRTLQLNRRSNSSLPRNLGVTTHTQIIRSQYSARNVTSGYLSLSLGLDKPQLRVEK
jgi:hypothetical protein